LFVENEGLPKMSKNMNKHATKRKSATENSILKFLTVSSVSSDSIVKGIIDDIIKTAVKTAEVDDQKTKYLQHFINKHDTIVSN
jgi:2-oxoglutarate dehydrogenase complex dehydrogenase (E1) component-like enzyme